jgi:hypothetical protein
LGDIDKEPEVSVLLSYSLKETSKMGLRKGGGEEDEEEGHTPHKSSKIGYTMSSGE